MKLTLVIALYERALLIDTAYVLYLRTTPYPITIVENTICNVYM